jgi:hypothetical protein
LSDCLKNHQDEYLSPLSKFPKLSFFAWDLRTPQISLSLGEPLKKRLELEYDTLSALGRAMPKLEEAVAITEDVSEGEFCALVRNGAAARWGRSRRSWL